MGRRIRSWFVSGEAAVLYVLYVLYVLLCCLFGTSQTCRGAGRTSPCRGVGQRPTSFQSANQSIPFVFFVSFVIFQSTLAVLRALARP